MRFLSLRAEIIVPNRISGGFSGCFHKDGALSIFYRRVERIGVGGLLVTATFLTGIAEGMKVDDSCAKNKNFAPCPAKVTRAITIPHDSQIGAAANFI
jgi:hypothetical protein